VDGNTTADRTPPTVAAAAGPIEAASTEYLGRWHRLVSTTNWEKGCILCEWRAALIEAGAPAAHYTDEAWSRRVGNVTPQHVGRLRRVYQRFSTERGQYPGLYWSHFQAAVDWDDAEMWLEGAVQSGWSVSEMQAQRARTLGMLESQPAEPAEELDEDAPPSAAPPEAISGSIAEVQATEPSRADSPDASSADAASEDFLPADSVSPDLSDACADEGVSPVRPLENVPLLPADLEEAFESFKLAIVRHRMAGWQEVSCDDVLAALDALRQLALAPAQG
jgi:hypothetical protein